MGLLRRDFSKSEKGFRCGRQPLKHIRRIWLEDAMIAKANCDPIIA